MKSRKISRGLRDLLPPELKVRRFMEEKAAALFASYAYEEVMTPTFEYLEVVEMGTGGNIREELFLFMDREGGILSLRPEMTTGIARLAATHLRDAVFPQRLYYLSNSFRYVQPHLAQYREFWQAGIELLGAEGVRADAEVITIAVKALQEMGLDNFKISLNQIAIFNSLLDDSGLNREEKDCIRSLVENKDLVELSRVLESLDIDDELKETIAILPVLHGGIEVLNRLPYVEKNQRALAAVQELREVYETLQLCGVIDHIVVDMGVLRGLDYYTGTVFEGYSPELGYGLLGGGRYDHLLGKFGFPCPATGFALVMDRLALLLKHPAWQEAPRYLVGGKDFAAVIARAEELRKQGFAVEIDVEGKSRQELERKLEGRENCITGGLIYV